MRLRLHYKVALAGGVSYLEREDMRKIWFISFILLSGCSITYSPVTPLGDNKHRITTYGNAFSTAEDLQVALNKKASEVCGNNQYEFIENELKVTSGDVYTGGVSPTYMKSGTVYAIVQCL